MKYFFISTWFQLLWFLAVIGREDYQWWLIGCIAVTYLLTFVYKGSLINNRALSSVVTLVTIFILGITMDSLNSTFNILQFEVPLLLFSTTSFPQPPIWMMGLWISFAWYACQMSSILLRYHWVLISLLGGVGGAMSYLAGHKFGAVEWPLGDAVTLLILFFEWFLLSFFIQKTLSNQRWDHEAS